MDFLWVITVEGSHYCVVSLKQYILFGPQTNLWSFTRISESQGKTREPHRISRVVILSISDNINCGIALYLDLSVVVNAVAHQKNTTFEW